METRLESYMIFAIDGGEDEVYGARKRAWFETCLKEAGIGFKRLCGCYNGALERSYIVNLRHADTLRGWYARQETVLELGPRIANSANDGSRIAQLRGVGNGLVEPLGVFRAVSEDTAHRAKCWTYDPATGLHYVAGVVS